MMTRPILTRLAAAVLVAVIAAVTSGCSASQGHTAAAGSTYTAKEKAFLAALNQQGGLASGVSPETAIAAGKQICAERAAGKSQSDAGWHMWMNDVSAGGSATPSGLARAAEKAFCPKYYVAAPPPLQGTPQEEAFLAALNRLGGLDIDVSQQAAVAAGHKVCAERAAGESQSAAGQNLSNNISRSIASPADLARVAEKALCPKYYVAPPPPVTLTSQRHYVVFKVWGSGLPSIQYGSDSNTISPTGPGTGLGPVGDGVALPWQARIPVSQGAFDNALYWVVTAQLEGSGDIEAAVYFETVRHYSNGTAKRSWQTLATAHAAGGYNIASAQYNGP